MFTMFLLAFSAVPIINPAAPAPKVTPVLWKEPKAATTADWIWGPGGEARAPRPPFQFVKENVSGTNPKIEVKDAAGSRWVVKFGGEVHTEPFAARLLEATGYFAGPTFFVPQGMVNGVHGLKRAKRFVSREGKFLAARFQLRDNRGPALVKGMDWAWTRNPFLGSDELNGLKILMMLMSNWDAKDSRDGDSSNTAVFDETTQESTIRRFAFTDWGASLGRWGGMLKRDRWDLAAYKRQTREFVKGVHDGNVVWGYVGKHNHDLTNGVTVQNVRWLLPYLTRITPEQLRAGLIASGATEASAKGFSRCIQDRIAQLRRVAGMLEAR